MEFSSTEEASRAIQQLHGSDIWPDAHAPLSVEPMMPAAAPPSHEEESLSSVFFAKVPPCVPASELWEVFSACGTVVKVNLFKQGTDAKTSKVGN